MVASDKGFQWVPRFEPYSCSCTLAEVPEAQAEFDSYITLLHCDDPTRAGIILVVALWNLWLSVEYFDLISEFPLTNGLAKLFFLDFREKGLVL
jgi:hypothetical protein